MSWDKKRINNEIMQLKTFNSAGKENLLIIKLSRKLGLLIFPAENHRVFHKWSFYVLPLPPQETQTH